MEDPLERMKLAVTEALQKSYRDGWVDALDAVARAMEEFPEDSSILLEELHRIVKACRTAVLDTSSRWMEYGDPSKPGE